MLNDQEDISLIQLAIRKTQSASGVSIVKICLVCHPDQEAVVREAARAAGVPLDNIYPLPGINNPAILSSPPGPDFEAKLPPVMRRMVYGD